jgi:elongation factor P hydroxylase
MHHADIAACFNREFGCSHHTRMEGGAAEPLYVPAGAGQPARLCYREDYAASALHEAAHWCIAGAQRRLLEDFGYPYEPPPRSAEAQARFYASEVRAQALESLFAAAAGVDFQPSADDLQADLANFSEQLAAAVPQLRQWLQSAAGARARQFLAALEVLRGTR